MHVVLFDIDGTLIDTHGAGRAAMSLALRDTFGQDDLRSIPFSGRTDRAIASDMFRRHQLEDSAENWQRLSAGYLTHLPQQLARRRGRTLPGVIELLDALAARENVVIGLLTGNTAAGAQAKLEHFGIWPRFRFGAYGDMHFDRDAVAAEASTHVRTHAGDLPTERVLVIGDTPLDIRCARHIGAKAIAVATGMHPREELADCSPDLLLDDLAAHHEVLAMLRL